MSEMVSPSASGLGGRRVAGQRSEASQKSRSNSIRAIKEKWAVDEFIDIFPANIRPDGQIGDSAINNLRAISKRTSLNEARNMMGTECVDNAGKPIRLTFKHTVNILASLKSAEKAASPETPSTDKKVKAKALTPKASARDPEAEQEVSNSTASTEEKVLTKTAAPKSAVRGRKADQKVLASKESIAEQKTGLESASAGKLSKVDENDLPAHALKSNNVPAKATRPDRKKSPIPKVFCENRVAPFGNENAQSQQKSVTSKTAIQSSDHGTIQDAPSTLPPGVERSGNELRMDHIDSDSNNSAKTRFVPQKRGNDEVQDQPVKKQRVRFSNDDEFSTQEVSLNSTTKVSNGEQTSQDYGISEEMKEDIDNFIPAVKLKQRSENLAEDDSTEEGSAEMKLANKKGNSAASTHVAERETRLGKFYEKTSQTADGSEVGSKIVPKKPNAKKNRDPVNQQNITAQSHTKTKTAGRISGVDVVKKPIESVDAQENHIPLSPSPVESELKSPPRHHNHKPGQFESENAYIRHMEKIVAKFGCASEIVSFQEEEKNSTISNNSARPAGKKSKTKKSGLATTIELSRSPVVLVNEPISKELVLSTDNSLDPALLTTNPLAVPQAEAIIKTVALNAKLDQDIILAVPTKLINWLSDMSSSICVNATEACPDGAITVALSKGIAPVFEDLVRAVDTFGNELKDVYRKAGLLVEDEDDDGDDEQQEDGEKQEAEQEEMLEQEAEEYEEEEEQVEA